MANRNSQITNRRVLITGASSGIGRQFALKLACGNDLLLVGRDINELKRTQDLAQAIVGHKAIEIHTTDLTDEGQRLELIEKVKVFIPNTLIFNAGGGEFALFLDRDWLGLQKEISLNILSNVHLTREILPIVLKKARAENHHAQLVLVSSHSAYMRVPRFSVYASAKSFLYSFGLTLMQELRAEPIDIMVLCPGATATRFSQRASIPLRMLSRPCEPEQVVQQAVARFGGNHLVITNNFDRVLYWANKFLPLSVFDRVVANLQDILLKRRGQPSHGITGIKGDGNSQ